MTTKMNQCRFCLKKMEINERMALIDEEITDQFTSITNLQLFIGGEFSQIICELCLRSLQLASAVKLQFIENQRKLHSFNDFDNDSVRSESPVSRPEVQAPVTKRRRKETRPMRSREEYVDPLELVSVHESRGNENISPEIRSEISIKQENNDEFESYNYDDQPSLLDEMPNNLDEIDMKPNLSQSINIPKTSSIGIKKELGQKNFQCPYCKNYYKRKPHMARHIEVAHMKVKYICVVPNCDLFFVRKERLKKHLEVNHADLSPLEMAYMVEQIRTMRPVYGSEVPVYDAPETNDETSENVQDTNRMPEKKPENGKKIKSEACSSMELNHDVPARFNTEQDKGYDAEREMLFRGLQLRYAPEVVHRINSGEVRDFMSDIREGDGSFNQTI